MRQVLSGKFFKRGAAVVAEELLGKYLCSQEGAFMITECEAYVGPEDKASHASRGKTKRNEPMFGECGRWYVYFCYGAHWMLNIVTGPSGFPAAVLIRGLKSGSTAGDYSGPGKLTKLLKIDGRFNGKSAVKKTGLWIEDRGVEIKKSDILKTRRIGVDYAGIWAKKPLRFVVKQKI